MTTPYTPGPWHTCHDAKCSCFTVMADHHPVAEVTNGPWGDTFPEVRFVPTEGGLRAEAFMEKYEYGEISDARARANWRLIAAAPEFAAGVEQMLAHEDAGGDGWWKGWEMLKVAYRKGVQP